MGSTKDVMELFAERDIRQHFSPYDGWTIAPVNGSQSGNYLYKATRGRWVGVETAYIAVSLGRTAGDEVIGALDTLPVEPRSKTKKFILAPQAADTSAVPPHMKVLIMSAFAFAGKDLVWLTKKKNAQEVVRKQPETTRAAA